ncbi:MAG: cyclase family protein [Propionibacteriaceae bacterium]|jgi:kynurenine formamidase|nr:cyclase family protein [Propionibacteriaceae bacterium]
MSTDYEFSDAAYNALCERYSTRGEWGEGDGAGTLNRLGPADVLGALSLVKEGTIVSCGGPSRFGTGEIADGTPSPATLHQWYDCGQDWAATNDRWCTDLHGARSQSHIDYLHHFFRDETNYLGWSRERTQAEFGLDPATGGIITRGVLLDIEGYLGQPATAAVRLPTLEAVIAAQGTQLRPNDAVIFNTGFDFDAADIHELGGPQPGIHIECADRILSNQPALIGSDMGTDASPSPVPGCMVPWHLLVLVYAGIRLLDGMSLHQLALACRERNRYEFALVVAPVKIPGASGSPLNALAVL